MINYTNPRPPAQRHPLRRVNENPALLRSPGPLESMLKTTTETGDIGIFSIRPNSSSAPFDRPHRPRSHPRDVDLLLPARSSGYDDNYYYHSDDHKRLRPYRDTTSEIISLYGSESQHTVLSSVSPASLEDDPRSYSMTTTSSKRIPSQKSTGTLQSQSSGSGFQRPRSPFPYPTRLKRPGVRPASPALRENGDIDYSRMVELERFSQRTIHGSYKPTYIHGSRRPPPLSLRAEANRSTTSLPSRPLHSPHFYAPGSYHARPPNPSMAWMPRQPSRNQPYPTDQSTRSASLTSIVEMYDKPITSNQNCAPPQSTGSIYYDYSEQFEDRPPWDVDVDVPLHPIPQRAENIRQSLLLMDDIQGRFDIGENESDSSESIMQEAEKDLMEPSHLSNSRERHSEETEAKQSTLLNEHGATDIEYSDLLNSIEIALNSISDKEQSQSPAVSNEASPNTKADTAVLGSMMSDPASTRSISPLESSSKILKASFNIEEDLRSRPSSQNGRISKLRYSLDPALSDFASVLSSFDRIGRLSISKDKEVQSSDMGSNESSVYQQGEAGAAALKRLSERPPPPSSNKAGTEERVYQRRHRRHIATMMISKTGVASDGFSQNSPRREDDVPILSPEPISPVRELRVKESIPQLMKSLPPLPREAQKLSGYGTGMKPDLHLEATYIQHQHQALHLDIYKPILSFCRHESAATGCGDAVISHIKTLRGDEILGKGSDLRRDAPRYMVYRDSKLEKSHCSDVMAEWTSDHVAFLIGCSYSFETELTAAGLPPRQLVLGRNVPMYRTTLRLCPSGVFRGGTYVVSMRPYKRRDIETVRNITRRFGATHGEPLDWGWEAVERLGIGDIDGPEWGDAPLDGDGKRAFGRMRVEGEGEGEDEDEDEEVPVFWGCGVTPQEAVMRAGLEGVVMAHAPGHMLVLDARDDDIAR
ncbi:hypothetical protein MKX08_010317 [Trichoderma sp. CBMAI-0020]|nr:hypothetical protein MKX08_010317 [Trichoderma sp. CBMAI-0020]